MYFSELASFFDFFSLNSFKFSSSFHCIAYNFIIIYNNYKYTKLLRGVVFFYATKMLTLPLFTHINKHLF